MNLRARITGKIQTKAAEDCRSPRRWREVKNGRQSGAFSLIELMVVVVLIGIMTAMILPAMKGTYEDALLRSTARKLVDGLTLANSRAVSISQVHRLRFDRKNGRYIIERKAYDGQSGAGFAAVKDTPGAEGEIDSRISIEFWRVDELPAAEGEAPLIARDSLENADGDAISFYADGTAESAQIILKDRQNFTLALRINPTTARVRLIELVRN